MLGTLAVFRRYAGMTARRFVIKCPDTNLSIIACVDVPRLARAAFVLKFECPCGSTHPIEFRCDRDGSFASAHDQHAS
jgi:hypothetical protein